MQGAARRNMAANPATGINAHNVIKEFHAGRRVQGLENFNHLICMPERTYRIP